MPTSRLTTGVASSQNGNSFGGGQLATGASIDINLSPVPALNLNSALSNAIIGTTIRGSVVNAIECWSDGVVWDTTNNRALMSVIDYDPSLRMRSGL